MYKKLLTRFSKPVAIVAVGGFALSYKELDENKLGMKNGFSKLKMLHMAHCESDSGKEKEKVDPAFIKRYTELTSEKKKNKANDDLRAGKEKNLGPADSIGAGMPSYIDHTLLKPESTPNDVIKICLEAIQYGFCSVCVNPVFVPLAVKTIQENSPKDIKRKVKVCAVVGFPLGANGQSKALETWHALSEGAEEIDMVISIGLLKAKEYDTVRDEIASVTKMCRRYGAVCKVIIETCLLTDEEKKIACRLCMEAGAHFVKTSTGFSTGGATIHDIKLMSKCVRPYGGLVKASGGVRTREFAEALIRAGASRIGASSSVAICSSTTSGSSVPSSTDNVNGLY